MVAIFFICRTDYFRCPRNFTLSIVPVIGEKVIWKKDGGEESEVVVLEDRGGCTLVVGKEDGLKEEVKKTAVIKLGGVIPVNVVTFQDGAEVFRGNVSYFNVMSLLTSLSLIIFRGKTAVLKFSKDGGNSKYC